MKTTFQNTLVKMPEYEIFDGDDFVTFYMMGVNHSHTYVTVAITNRGKISVVDYPLYENSLGLYFEYGPMFENVYLTEFDEV